MNFDPHKHPRNPDGEFRKVLGSLNSRSGEKPKVLSRAEESKLTIHPKTLAETGKMTPQARAEERRAVAQAHRSLGHRRRRNLYDR